MPEEIPAISASWRRGARRHAAGGGVTPTRGRAGTSRPRLTQELAVEEAVIDPEACVECGACEEVCRFGVISSAGAAERMERLPRKLGAPVLARLPFDRRVPAAAAAGEPMLAVERFAPLLQKLWDRLTDRAAADPRPEACPAAR